MWYWNSPFVVSDADLKSLKTIGVKTLYVREATFTTDGKNLLTEFHEHWQSNPPAIKIVLVYNFDGGVIRHFGVLANKTVAEDVANGIAHTNGLVLSHGIKPAGIQIDFDCPTGLLAKYADLLTTLRQKLVAAKVLSPGQTFSSTALQTWLGSSKYADLASAVDFLTPQFYESRTGLDVSKVAPIADIANLKNRVQKADGFGRPFYVGLATYGHALLYDAKGKLAGMYHGMKPSEALRHPSLELRSMTALSDSGGPASATEYAGEDLLKLVAVQGDLGGNGYGDTIAYLVPTAEMIAQQVHEVEAARAAHCSGIILYRFPAADDELSLPLVTVAEAMRGRKPEAVIEGSVARRSVPWALIGGTQKTGDLPSSYEVTLRNTGSAPTLLSDDGVTALLQFDRIGLEEVNPGDFDDARAGLLDSDGTFRACALAHANAVLLRKFRLSPGQTAKSGRIESGITGPKVTELVWRAKSAGGFKTIEGRKDAGNIVESGKVPGGKS